MARRTLKKGSKGKTVKELQELLVATGFLKGPVDGRFGPKTEAAVKAFQAQKILPIDGVAGFETWAALADEGRPVKAPKLATYRYVGPVKSNEGRATIIDDETAIWAMRMCVGEGGRRCSRKKCSAMLWALMYRWMLHPSRRHWPTYRFLMRYFSQPINPRWQRGGDLAEKYAGTAHCTEAKLEHREMVSSLTWDEAPVRIVNAVKAFQAGVLPPPGELQDLDRPRISNWASHKGMNRKYPWGIAFEKSRQPDWFFENRNLIRGTVAIET